VGRFILKVLLTAATVWAVATLWPQLVRTSGIESALLFALVLGVLNALLRPILVLVTLPLTVVTLGLFLLVVNGIVFWLATLFPVGVEVSGLFGAVVGALAVSVVNLAASATEREKRERD